MKIFKLLLILLLTFVVQPTLADSTTQIQARINNAIKEHAPNASIGIIVNSLTKNRTIYQKNPHQLFIPASILKILTAVSALSFLGPNYYFTTKILTKNSTIKNGTIDDDIYIYFDGDPSLTHQDIKDLIKQLASLGIKRVTGNVYIDDSIFDDEFLGSGWMWEDLNFCYASPISAIIIDKNCLALKLIAAKNPQQPTTLVCTQDHISITNNVVTKNLPSNKKNHFLKLNATNDNKYLLSGSIKPCAKPLSISIALRNIRLYTKELLLSELQENSINLLGSIKFKKIPENGRPYSYVVAKHRSPPLSELIRTMLKESDNTITDALYKKLGYLFFNEQSTWKKGFEAIKNILETQTGLAFKEMYLDDGCGISHHDMITPDLMIKILNYAYHNQTIKQPFIDALPHAGIDGTLEHRMLNLKNRVFAKTGSMGNVSALAGFIETKHKEKISFVIIINSFLGSPKQMHELLDLICTIIANS